MPQLRPFAADPAASAFALEARALWSDGQLGLRYRLNGPLELLVLAAAAAAPRRCDDLWQSSCFEAFVGVVGEAGYWELNLSPSGDWNLYRFDGYRRGGREETAIQHIPCRWQRSPHQLDLELSLPGMGWLPTADPQLEVALTTVLEHRQMGCQYWALKHCAAEPDFHQRASFVALEQLN
jgi:hypothetical protein